MTDSQIKSFEVDMIAQSKILIKQSEYFDAMFRRLLKSNWKNKSLVGNLNDSIKLNNDTIGNLENEIKDRNSRIT